MIFIGLLDVSSGARPASFVVAGNFQPSTLNVQLFSKHTRGYCDVKRIFLTLAIFSTAMLFVAFGLGMSIGDAKDASAASQSFVGWHLLIALGALVFAALVHAIVLTYFMGTGRWMEETSRAYQLDAALLEECRSLKYRLMPAMSGCLLLLILTAGFGAAADPASAVGFRGWGGIPAATIHFLVAAVMLTANVFVNVWEFTSITRNSAIVEEVLAQVRKIRTERGLPV